MTPKITSVPGSDAVLIPPQHVGQFVTLRSPHPVTVHHTSDHDLLLGKLRQELAEARSELALLPKRIALLTHQRDVWKRMAITAASSVQDLTAARDMLREENNRLVPDAVQAHARNDELCREHMQLRRQIADLTAARDALQQQVHEYANKEAAQKQLMDTLEEIGYKHGAPGAFPASALRRGDGLAR